jgi:hypothetical protein
VDSCGAHRERDEEDGEELVRSAGAIIVDLIVLLVRKGARPRFLGSLDLQILDAHWDHELWNFRFPNANFRCGDKLEIANRQSEFVWFMGSLRRYGSFGLVISLGEE